MNIFGNPPCVTIYILSIIFAMTVAGNYYSLESLEQRGWKGLG